MNLVKKMFAKLKKLLFGAVNREHHVEYIDEASLKIDGVTYTVNRNESGEIISIESSGNIPYKLSMEVAAMNPFGIDAQYLTLVRLFLDLQNKAPEEFTEEELDAGIDLAEDLTGQPDVVSPKPGVQVKPTASYTQDEINEEIEKILDTEVPSDIIQIFSEFTTPKNRKNVSLEDRTKLFDWAVKAVEKLNKLDASNKSVIDALDYLSKSVINPISKKDGKQNTNKQPRKRKAGEKKAKTTKINKKSGTKKTQPSTPKNDGSSSIEGAEKHVKDAYDKMHRETAVQIEDLMKGETVTLFTDSSIKEALDFSQYDSTRSQENQNNKIDTNPFEDDDLINGLNCNM